MNILYYSWHENSLDDCRDAMQKAGHNVSVVFYNIVDYIHDEKFERLLDEKLQEVEYDCVFTFDFIPIIAKISKRYNIKYISWVYDSPNITMDTDMVYYNTNYIFHFDSNEVMKYKKFGVENIFYMPLAYNEERYSMMTKCAKERFLYDVSFVGSLYNNEDNYYRQINYLPEFVKGYIDGVCEAQQLIYGYDLCENVITDSICNEISKYVKFDMGDDYRNNRNDIIKYMVKKEITARERTKLLRSVGNNYRLRLYSNHEQTDLNCSFGGYAKYIEETPMIFYQSKINLNFTLRSIQSGIPLRIIDIIGVGGFVITNYQADLEKHFTNGKDIVWFENETDLIEKIDYYLKHDDERQEIANNGHEVALNNFTYEKKLKEIFNIVFHVNK